MNIGYITELEVATLAIKMGIKVSLPLDPESRYDQIWDINGKLLKIQIKTCELIKNGAAIRFGNKAKRPYRENEIDAIVTAHENRLYLIPFEEINSSSYKTLFFHLEKEDAMNYHQVNWAKDYEFKL